MKAAVLHGKRDIRIEQVPVPTIGKKDILVEMKVAGISRIEPIIYEGGYIAKGNIIAGFQAAGLVKKTGEEVASIKVGQRVSFDPNIHCGYCFYCKRGETLYCENLKSYGVNRTGVFAEYFSVPESNIYALPDNMPFEYAPLVEHTSCVLHSVEKSGIELGDTVVVLGAGLVGNIFIQMVKARGAASVIAVDISKEKLKKALEMGADYTVEASKEDVAKSVIELTEGRGADVIFDTAGVPAAFEETVKYAGKGASIIIFATHPKESTVTINPFELLEKEICIQATYCNPLTYGKALKIISEGRINLKPLISTEVSLDNIVEGIKKKRDEDIFYVLVRN